MPFDLMPFDTGEFKPEKFKLTYEQKLLLFAIGVESRTKRWHISKKLLEQCRQELPEIEITETPTEIIVSLVKPILNPRDEKLPPLIEV